MLKYKNNYMPDLSLNPKNKRFLATAMTLQLVPAMVTEYTQALMDLYVTISQTHYSKTDTDDKIIVACYI